MAKQTEIPGTERKVVQEVEDAAAVYVKSRDKRMKASIAEKADKVALIEVMKKNRLTVYAIPDDGLVITVTKGDDGVKVSKAEEPEDDAPDEAAKD